MSCKDTELTLIYNSVLFCMSQFICSQRVSQLSSWSYRKTNATTYAKDIINLPPIVGFSVSTITQKVTNSDEIRGLDTSWVKKQSIRLWKWSDPRSRSLSLSVASKSEVRHMLLCYLSIHVYLHKVKLTCW